MRIGTLNMINQVYNTGSAKKSGSTVGAGYASFQDEISFSKTGKDMQVAKNALAGVPDVREAKIAELKSRIEAGTYDVSLDDFAAKLAATYASQTF